MGHPLTAMLFLGSLLAACAPGAAPAGSTAPTRPPATAPAPAAQVAAPTAIPPTPAARREPLHLDVGYVPSLVYAPLYVAYEKSYFRERGLDLTLEPGGGSRVGSKM